MSINIKELALKDVRRVIPIQINGEEKEVQIFNLTNQNRNEFIGRLRDVGEKPSEDVVKEIFEDIYKSCTDLIIKDGFMDSLNNPRVELMQIQLEIQEIMHELQCEEMISRINDLNQVESMLYAQLTLKKSERIENLMKLINEFDKENVE